jgi:hypothetical protein
MQRDAQRRAASTIVAPQSTDEMALPESQGGLNLSASLSQRLAFSSMVSPSIKGRHGGHTSSTSSHTNTSSDGIGEDYKQADMKKLAADMRVQYPLRDALGGLDGTAAKGLMDRSAKLVGGYPAVRTIARSTPFPPVKPTPPTTATSAASSSSSAPASSSTSVTTTSATSETAPSTAAASGETPQVNLLTQMAMANLLALTEDLPSGSSPPLSFWKVVDKLLAVIVKNTEEAGCTEFANWCLTLFQAQSLPLSLDASISSRIRTAITQILLAQGTPASILKIVQYLLGTDRPNIIAKSSDSKLSSVSDASSELSSLSTVVQTFESNQHIRSKRILRVSWSSHASLLDVIATPLLPVSVTEAQQQQQGGTSSILASLPATASSTSVAAAAPSISSSNTDASSSLLSSGPTVESSASGSSVSVGVAVGDTPSSSSSSVSTSVPSFSSAAPAAAAVAAAAVVAASSSSSGGSSTVPSSGSSESISVPVSLSSSGTTSTSTEPIVSTSAAATAASSASSASSSISALQMSMSTSIVPSGLLKASRLIGWSAKDTTLYERICAGGSGRYLYILSSRFGLVKVGTGEGNTMTGNVYAQNGTLFPHAPGAIAFVKSPLYTNTSAANSSNDGDDIGYLAIRSPYLPDCLLRIDPSTLLIVDRILLSDKGVNNDGELTPPACSWTLKCDGIPFHEDRLWGDKGPWATLPLHGWIDAAHRRIEVEILAGNWKFGQTMMLGPNHALIFESNGVWLTKAGQATPTRCELDWTPAAPGMVMAGGPIFSANGNQLLIVMAKAPKLPPPTVKGQPPPAPVLSDKQDDPSIERWTIPSTQSEPRRVIMVPTKVIKPIKPLPVSRYQVGQNLRARWQTPNGNIYDVRVVAVNDTNPPTYHLRYADGDEDRNVPEVHIIDPATGQASGAPPGVARQPSNGGAPGSGTGSQVVAPAQADLDDDDDDEDDIDDLEQALAASVASSAPPPSVAAAAAPAAPSGQPSGILGYQLEWDCGACTYVNDGARTVCEICGTARPPPPVIQRAASIPSSFAAAAATANVASAAAATVASVSSIAGSVGAAVTSFASAIAAVAAAVSGSSSSSDTNAAAASSSVGSSSSGAAGSSTATPAPTIAATSPTPSWAASAPMVPIVIAIMSQSVLLTVSAKLTDDTVGPVNPEEGDEACDTCGCMVHVRCLEPDCNTSLCNYCHQMANWPIRASGVTHQSSHRVYIGRKMSLLKGKRLTAMVRAHALSYIDERDNTLVLVSRPVQTAGNMSPCVIFDLTTGQLVSRCYVSTLATDLTLVAAPLLLSNGTSSESKVEKEGKSSDSKREAASATPAPASAATSRSAVVWGICVDGSLERWRCPDKLPPPSSPAGLSHRNLALSILQRLPGLESGANLQQSMDVILNILQSASTSRDTVVQIASLQLIRTYVQYMLDTDGVTITHPSLIKSLSTLRTMLLSYLTTAEHDTIKGDNSVASYSVDILALGFELLWPTWVQRFEYLSELLRITTSTATIPSGGPSWPSRLFSAIVEYYRKQLLGMYPSHHGVPGDHELEKNTPESITSPLMKRLLDAVLRPQKAAAAAAAAAASSSLHGPSPLELRGSLSSGSDLYTTNNTTPSGIAIAGSASALQSLSYVILAYERQLYLVASQLGVQPNIAVAGKKTHYVAGELVRARWRNGAVYDATIVAVNSDGTYSVLYSDGDRDERVPEASVTESRGTVGTPPQPPPEPGSVVYAAGQQVRARWHGGGNYNAVVQGINPDGTYDVLYEDGDRDRVCPVRNIIDIRGPLLTANSSDRSAAVEVATRAAELQKASRAAAEARAALASSALLHTLSEVVAVCLEFFGAVIPSAASSTAGRTSPAPSASTSGDSTALAISETASVGLRMLFHTSCFLLSSLDKKNLPRTVLSQIIESSMSFITRLRSTSSSSSDDSSMLVAFQSELTVVRMLFHRSLESIFEVKSASDKSKAAKDPAAVAAAAALAAAAASSAAASTSGTAASSSSSSSSSGTAASQTSTTSASTALPSKSSTEIEQQIMARLLPMVLSKKGATSHIGFLQSFIDSDASLSSLIDEKANPTSPRQATTTAPSQASYLNMAPHDFLSAFFALCLREMGGGAASLDLSFSFKSEKAFVAALIRLLSSPPYYSNGDANPSLLELCQSMAESMAIRILVERSRAARRKVIQQAACPTWWKALLAHVFRHIRRPIIDILHGPPVPIAATAPPPAVAATSAAGSSTTAGTDTTTATTAASTATSTASASSSSTVPSLTATPAPSEASSASSSPSPSPSINGDMTGAAAASAAAIAASTSSSSSSSSSSQPPATPATAASSVPDIIYLQPAEVAQRAADKWAANASFFMNDFHRVRSKQRKVRLGYASRPQKLTKKAARKITVPSSSPTGDDKESKLVSREAPSTNIHTRASAAAASLVSVGASIVAGAVAPALPLLRSQSLGITLGAPKLERARSDPSHDRQIPLEELHGSLNLLADVEWVADFIQQDHPPQLLQQLAQSAVDHRAHAAARLRLLQFFNESMMSAGGHGEALIDECLPLVLRTLRDSEHFHILQPTKALRISSLFGASHRPALTGARHNDTDQQRHQYRNPFQLASPTSQSSATRFSKTGDVDDEDAGHGLSDESASVLMTFTKHLVKLLDASFDAAVNVVNQSRTAVTGTAPTGEERRQRVAALHRCEHRIRCILHFFAGDFSSPVDIDVLMRCNVLHILGRFVFHPSLTAQPHLTRMAWNAMLYLIMVATNTSHQLSDDNRAMLSSVSSSLMPALLHRLSSISELPSLQPVCHLPAMRVVPSKSKGGFPLNCQEKDFLEACDSGGAWYIGRVLKRDPKKGLFIRYDGWEENYDEWFPLQQTPRLAPLFTRLTTVHPRASERPQALMFNRDEINAFHKSSRFAELAASRSGAAQHIQAALAAARAAGQTDLPMSRQHIHPLLFIAGLEGHFCDTCQSQIQTAYRCAACNWDMCNSCYERTKVSVTVAAVSTAVGEVTTSMNGVVTPATAIPSPAAAAATTAAPAVSSSSASATSATTGATTSGTVAATTTSSSTTPATATTGAVATTSSSAAVTSSSSAASSSSSSSSASTTAASASTPVPTMIPLSDKAIEKALEKLLAADKVTAAALEEERVRDRRESYITCSSAARSNAAVRTVADILRLLPKLGSCGAADIVQLLPWLSDDMIPSLVKEEMVRWLATQLVYHSPDQFTDLRTNVASDLFHLLGSMLLGARFASPSAQPISNAPRSDGATTTSGGEGKGEKGRTYSSADNLSASTVPDRRDWWLYQSWAVHGEKMADRQRLIAQLVYLIRWFIMPSTSTPSSSPSLSTHNSGNMSIDIAADAADTMELALRARRQEWSREFTSMMETQLGKLSHVLTTLQSLRLREDDLTSIKADKEAATATPTDGSLKSTPKVMEQKAEKDHKSSSDDRERKSLLMMDLTRTLATLEVFGGCERGELRQGGLVEIGNGASTGAAGGSSCVSGARFHARVSNINIAPDSTFDATTGIETGVVVEAIPEQQGGTSGNGNALSSVAGPSLHALKDVIPLPDLPPPPIHLFPSTLSHVLEGLRLLGSSAAAASDLYTTQRSGRKSSKAKVAATTIFKHAHPLIRTSGLQRHICDTCRGSMGTEGIAWRCQFCDYDLCPTCYTRSIAMETAANPTAMTPPLTSSASKTTDVVTATVNDDSKRTSTPTTPPAQWLLMMEMHSKMMTIAHSFLTSPLSSSSSMMSQGSDAARLRHELVALVPSLLKLSQQQHTVRFLMHPNQLVDAAHQHITSLREAEERRAIEDSTIASLQVPRQIRSYILTTIEEDTGPVALYKAGQKVRAKWHGGAVYDATIQGVNDDGTYDVIYSDGDRDKKTREDWILELVADAPGSATAAAGGAAQASQPSGPPLYTVGQHVRAQWRAGQEYNAIVRAVNPDGTYHLRYEDGDEDRNVRQPHIIRVVAPPMRPLNGYAAGMRIAAKWRGRGRYNATILAVNADGTFHLRFEDGDENRSAPEDAILELQPGQPNIPAVPAPIATPGAAGTAATTASGTAAAVVAGTAPATTVAVASAAGVIRRYAANQPVRARWQGGRVYNADIIAVNADGTYNVRFEDGDIDPALREDQIVESRGPPPGAASTNVAVPLVKPAILEAVDAIVSMGIPEQQARVALIRHRGDLQRAADLVLQGTELTSPTTWQEFLMGRNEWDIVQAWLNRPPPGTPAAAPAAPVASTAAVTTSTVASSSSSSTPSVESASSAVSSSAPPAAVGTSPPVVASSSSSEVVSAPVVAASSVASTSSVTTSSSSSPPSAASTPAPAATTVVTNGSVAASSSSAPVPAVAAAATGTALQPLVYAPGDHVIVEWPDSHEIFTATVQSRNEATNEYHLIYEDGDEHPSVGYNSIISRHDPSSFVQGAVVQARHSGSAQFQQCIIQTVIDDGMMFELLYPNGDNDIVPVGQVFPHPFPLPRTVPVAAAQAPSAAAATGSAPVSTTPTPGVTPATTTPAAAAAPTAPAITPIVVGTRVVARWGNNNQAAYGATVTAVNPDGTYALIYEDGDRAPSVAIDRILSVVGAGLPAAAGATPGATPAATAAAAAAAAAAAVPAGSPASKYPIGARLRAKWKGGGDNIYFAVVTAHNRDGTIQLKYDDGDVDPACPNERILEMVTNAPVLDTRAPPGAPRYHHSHMTCERSIEEAMSKKKTKSEGQRIDHWSPAELLGLPVRLREKASVQQVALPWAAQYGVIVRLYIDDTPITDTTPVVAPASTGDNKEKDGEQKKKADPPRREPVALVQFAATTGRGGVVRSVATPGITIATTNQATNPGANNVVATASPHYLAWFRITDLVRAERAPHSALGNARATSRALLLQRSLAAQRQLIGAQATQVLQSVLMLKDSLMTDHDTAASSSSQSVPSLSSAAPADTTSSTTTATAASLSTSSSSSPSALATLPLSDLLPCLPNVGSFSIPPSAHALGNFDIAHLTDGVARHAALSYVSSLFLPTPAPSSTSSSIAGGRIGADAIIAWNERYRQLRELISQTGDGLARTRIIKYGDARISVANAQIQCSPLARFPAGSKEGPSPLGSESEERALVTSALALRTNDDDEASLPASSSELLMIAFDDSWRSAVLRGARLAFFSDHQRLSLLQSAIAPVQRAPIVVPAPVWLDLNKTGLLSASRIVTASLFTTAAMEHARFIVDLLLYLDNKAGLDGTQKMMIQHALHAIYLKLVHFLVMLYIAPEMRPSKKTQPTPAQIAAAVAAAAASTLPATTSSSAPSASSSSVPATTATTTATITTESVGTSVSSPSPSVVAPTPATAPATAATVASTTTSAVDASTSGATVATSTPSTLSATVSSAAPSTTPSTSSIAASAATSVAAVSTDASTASSASVAAPSVAPSSSSSSSAVDASASVASTTSSSAAAASSASAASVPSSTSPAPKAALSFAQQLTSNGIQPMRMKILALKLLARIALHWYSSVPAEVVFAAMSTHINDNTNNETGATASLVSWGVDGHMASTKLYEFVAIECGGRHVAERIVVSGEDSAASSYLSVLAEYLIAAQLVMQRLTDHGMPREQKVAAPATTAPSLTKQASNSGETKESVAASAATTASPTPAAATTTITGSTEDMMRRGIVVDMWTSAVVDGVETAINRPQLLYYHDHTFSWCEPGQQQNIPTK